MDIVVRHFTWTFTHNFLRIRKKKTIHFIIYLFFPSLNFTWVLRVCSSKHGTNSFSHLKIYNAHIFGYSKCDLLRVYSDPTQRSTLLFDLTFPHAHAVIYGQALVFLRHTSSCRFCPLTSMVYIIYPVH